MLVIKKLYENNTFTNVIKYNYFMINRLVAEPSLANMESSRGAIYRVLFIVVQRHGKQYPLQVLISKIIDNQ